MNFLKNISLGILASIFVLSFLGSNIFASAEESFSETRDVLHPGAQREGFYATLETGQLFFSGNDRLDFRDGWVIGLKAGYDLWKYIGVEGIFKYSGHSTTSSARSAGQAATSFFVYQGLFAVKGAYPITKRFHLEAGVGGGLWYSNPQMRTQSARGEFYGELGIEYFLRTRGLSMGLDPSLAGVVNLKSAIFQATGFFRYTF